MCVCGGGGGGVTASCCVNYRPVNMDTAILY